MSDDLLIRMANLEQVVAQLLITQKTFAPKLMVKQANLVLEQRLNTLETAQGILETRVDVLEAV